MLRRQPQEPLRPRRWLGLLTAVLLAGWGLGCRTVDPRVDRLFASRAADLLTAPLRVCRLAPEPAEPAVTLQRHGFEVLAGPTPLAAADRRGIVSVLLAPATYEWEPTARLRLCGFEPTFALDGGGLEVLVSLVCDRVRVHAGETFVAEQEITDAAHNTILAWLQRCYPDDSYVQLLQPN